MYLVTYTRPDLTYPISYLSQSLIPSSKSHLGIVKCLIWYITGTKDLKLSFPYSDVWENTLERYSDSDDRHWLDTRQGIPGNLFWVNNSMIYIFSMKQMSVVTSIYLVQYMGLVLTMK
jgi:hypothetical protein